MIESLAIQILDKPVSYSFEKERRIEALSKYLRRSDVSRIDIERLSRKLKLPDK